jgi:hypothetical protein
MLRWIGLPSEKEGGGDKLKPELLGHESTMLEYKNVHEKITSSGAE